MTTHQPEGLREKIEEILSCDDYISASQVVEEKGLLWRMKPSWIKRTRKQLLSLFSAYIKQRKPEEKTILEIKLRSKKYKDQFPFDLGECSGYNQALDDYEERLLEEIK